MIDNESPAPMRIVVAEDETIIRLDIVETLTAQGYEVLVRQITVSGRSSWSRNLPLTSCSWISRCR